MRRKADGTKWRKRREKAGDDSSSDESDDSDEDEAEEPALGQKRRRGEPVAPSSKRVKLLTKLEEPKSAAQASRAAQIWFSQDVFAGMDDLNDDVDDDDEDEDAPTDNDEDEDGDEDNWQDEVSHDGLYSIPGTNLPPGSGQ